LATLADNGPAATAYAEAGRLYLSAGDPRTAAQTRQPAIELFRDRKDQAAEAAAGHSLGRALRKLGQPDEASAAFEASVALYQRMQGPETALVATRLLELGHDLQALKRSAKAQTAFVASGNLFAQHGQHTHAIGAYQVSAELFRATKQPREAAASFELAATSAIKANDRSIAAEHLGSARAVLRAAGLHQEAAKIDKQLTEVAPPPKAADPPKVVYERPYHPPAASPAARPYWDGPGGIAGRM
jgi:tetratricopeptide (TPR) repeat protein